MNETELTVAGRVVADPEHRTTRAGMQFTTFRLASTVRRRTREGVYVDGPTSFYNVSAFRSLGINTHETLRKGDPVVVHGRLTINDWQRSDESWGSSADIEAISLGHDLTYGTTSYTKANRSHVNPAAEEAAAQGYQVMTERLESSDEPLWGAPPAPADPDAPKAREAAAEPGSAAEHGGDVRLSA